uniref:Tryptophan synthase alpha chain n=1 Tax=Sebdenia flabellata TaxID=42024 RepID=A0A1C9C9X2_9FLOR|nr:tryptophan synthase alpha subunit [Sebdenia flabellata]AOM65183.1 tryptophan synthase alpha subunit [Sebdenia flabellata]
MVFIYYNYFRVANSMVEYSAFNRLVPGSNPGQPNYIVILFNSLFLLNYTSYKNMNTISQVLHNKNSKCALIPFITAGYPDIKTTIDALYALDNKGADVIELGIPYSDALADGPIIQESSKIALEQGVYINQVLDILKMVSPNLRAPVVIFTYYNPMLSRGIEKFIQDISNSGAKGLIIPDLPFEETDYVIQLCTQCNIELILFVAPTSSQSRILAILSKSPGCIYLVSSHGVTGLREQIDSQINSLADFIKQNTNKLVMVGFGISSPEQAYKISRLNIDGVVIGSAFIRSMTSKSSYEAVNNLGTFCDQVRSAIDVL